MTFDELKALSLHTGNGDLAVLGSVRIKDVWDFAGHICLVRCGALIFRFLPVNFHYWQQNELRVLLKLLPCLVFPDCAAESLMLLVGHTHTVKPIFFHTCMISDRIK